MHQLIALRPLVTAGAAAVGASLIALTPAVSNDVTADLQHSAANIQHRAVQLASDDYAVNPIQTWIDFFQTTGTNLQALYNAAANAALGFYTYPNTNPLQTGLGFWTSLETAGSAFQSGNMTGALSGLSQAFFAGPIQNVLQNLENTLNIPIYATQALANATSGTLSVPTTLTGDSQDSSLIVLLGAYALGGFSASLVHSLGASLQGAYDAFAAGNAPEGILNLVNIPGAVSDSFVNGIVNGVYTQNAFLAPVSQGTNFINPSLLPMLTIAFPQELAKKIVAPGAPNIVEGGSLATEWTQFVGPLTNLGTTSGSIVNALPVAGTWPSPNAIVDSFVNVFENYVFAGGLQGAAAAAALPADLSGLAPSIAADVAGLAPSVAADLSGIAPSIATNIAGMLAPEFGTLAAHLLTSLF